MQGTTPLMDVPPTTSREWTSTSWVGMPNTIIFVELAEPHEVPYIPKNRPIYIYKRFLKTLVNKCWKPNIP
jgi:hypothetical protein